MPLTPYRMKKIVLLLTLLPVFLTAQETPPDTAKKDSLEGWKTGGTGALNFTQTQFTNWAAGGENSLSATGLVNLFANHRQGKRSWENMLDMSYGFLRQDENPFRKNDDKLELSSKFGLQAG